MGKVPPRSFGLVSLTIMLAVVVILSAPDARAQQLAQMSPAADGAAPVSFARTSSPRETLRSYMILMRQNQDALIKYRNEKTAENLAVLVAVRNPLYDLIDLSEIPRASRQQIAVETMASLADIFARIELPPLEDVPDASAPGMDEPPEHWRIPNTPIRIARIDHGTREGEFLFTERTSRIVPRFAARIEGKPLLVAGGVESWKELQVQLTGPLIPRALEDAMPQGLKAPWLETPVWKTIATLVLVALSVLVLYRVHRLVAAKGDETHLGELGHKLLTPIAICAAMYALDWFVVSQLKLFGDAAELWDAATIVVFYAAGVWVFWLLVLALFEAMILSPAIPEESLDANLLRLLARMIGLIASVFIIAYGAQEIGLPLFSVLAGLGVGGLAVALALRPTMENLIGGVILYLDKPVRVGDFCSYGGQMGTVEAIGVRTTQIRALDRTLVAIPNAQFADSEIINWARCDKMLINPTIGVRYETTPDQMRFVLATLREMMIAHPKIETETVRVRMSEFADFSKNITIRIFALTNDWNDFHAIREDVLLRVDEIVVKAGVGFAFPSRTLYLGRDAKPDEERGTESERKVANWRQSGQLPFPTSPTERILALDSTLDYPPQGSASESETTASGEAAAEPLAAPETEETAEPAKREKPL